MFQRAYRLQRITTRGKSDGYLLGALYNSKNAAATNVMQGEIFRFTNIDPNAEWFNSQTGKPAEDGETEQINIPDHLHPNMERILFVFRPREHQFWFISRDRKTTIGPTVAANFLQQVFDEVCRKHNMPRVEVTLVPDEAAVDEVLGMARITKIVFEYKRPNGDDAGDLEMRIMKRMEQRNVDRLREEMTSSDPKGIEPDDELKVAAEVAANNGYVESTGYDAAGLPAIESTRERPARYVELLDEDVESVWSVLERLSSTSKGKS